MSRINAGREVFKWLRIVGSLALFASLLTVAFAGTGAAQTCNENGAADLQISAPTSNTSAPGDITSFEYRNPGGVGTDDFIYVTVTDVCGILPASANLAQEGWYPNDFQVTFPSSTPLAGDLFDTPPSSPDFDLGEDISGPSEGTALFPACQYNPAGVFGTTNSVSCPVPGGPNGGLQTGDTMTLGFFVQLPVNQNSVTFTASLDVNNDMPATIGSPQNWTTQIAHPDLSAEFQDPNNPPATVYIGTGFNYDVTFQNTGAGATPGPVNAVIQLPVAGLSSASVNSTTDGSCTYNHPTLIDQLRSVTCTFDPMQPGSQVVVSIGATSSTNTGYYTATATIDPNDVTGSEGPNNMASTTTYVTDLAAPPPIYAPIVGTPIPVGVVAGLPETVAVDPDTGMVFEANIQTGSVVAVSEASQSVVAGIGVGGAGFNPAALAVDPVSGTVYVAELSPPQVVMISEDPSDPADDEMTATVTVPPDTEGFDGPQGIAVLPGTAPDTGTVYVSNGASDTVSVISEATNSVTSVIQIPAEGGASDSYPLGVTADPVTGLVYVADQGDGYVSVISGSTLLGSIGVGGELNDPTGIAADPDTGTVYVTVPAPLPGGTAAEVYVIREDPTSPADATVATAIAVPPAGGGGATYGVPESIAVNPGTASVYVSNFEGSLDVISEDTADPAADAFNLAEDTNLVPPTSPDYPDFDEVYGVAVDTSAGNTYSGTAYVMSDQTEDMYPVFFPPGQQPQSISFTAPAAGTVGGSAILSATGGGSDYPVTFTVDASSGAGVCSVSGDTVSYTAPGSCVIDANQAGNIDYADAPQVSQTIAVSPEDQSISFTAPATGTVGGSATLSGTGGGSGNPVVFSVDPSSGPGVCSVSGTNGATVNYLAVGSCVIDANQAGDASYTAAPQVTQIIIVGSVVQAQSIGFTAPPTGTVGASAPLAATGGGSGNPVIFTVDPSSGAGVCTVSGTNGATVNYLAAGSCVIDANQAGDSEYSAAPQVIQTITVSAQLVVTTSSLPAGSAGGGYDQSLTASGGATPYTWSVVSGSLPPGLTLSASGQISGTATSGGSFRFTAVVTDSETPAAAAAQALTITVDAVPDITSAGSVTFTAGTAGSFTVTTTGYPAATLTEAGALPSGVAFASNGDGGAILSGTPAAGSEGTYPVTISAANSAGAANTQSFVLTVSGGLDITSADSATATAGAAFSFTITASGTPAATLTHTGTLPSGVTFTANSNGTATLAGTPAATAYGVYPITVAAKNSTGATSQAFLLTVAAAPAFSSAAAVTETAGVAFSYGVTSTAYPTAALTTATLPGGFTFAGNGNGTGTLSGSSALAAGTYSITITAANATASVSQTITLTVKAAGKTDQVTAFASPVTATATVGTPLSFTVATAGSPTSYTSNVSHSGTLPAGVSFTNNGNGTAMFSGTPSAAAEGSYMMTLTEKNPAGTTTQSFVLTVIGAPAIRSAATASATVGSAFSIQVSATGSPTPAMTESGALPQGLTWADNGNGTATLAGLPTVNQGGVYTLTLTATNSLGSFEQTFTLTVDQAPAITSAATASAAHGSPFTFTFTTTGCPQATFTRTGTVPGLTLTSNGKGTATLSGTPTKPGTYTLTVTAKNSVGSAAQTFTLVVK